MLNTVYPSLLEEIRDAAWEQLEKQPVLSPSTARLLSRILGVPLEGSLDPNTVRVLQNAQSVLNPSQNPQVAGSGRPAAPISADPLTQAQRLEGK